MKAIIYPMFTLVTLTFIIGFSLGISRLISARTGQVDPRYFKLMSDDYSPPDHLEKLGRNFSNLFEVPVLFYLLGILVILFNIESPLMLMLSWLFVALRVVHSWIHITYNKPLHRFYAFLLSSITVLIMWVQFIVMVS